MKRYYGCDAHKRYSVFTFMGENGDYGPCVRVENERDQLRSFLGRLPPGSPIGLESVGHWYWMVDEMERAGHRPRLAHAGKAKVMMGQINKTDKLDARGLAMLTRNGTLPAVWIPPGELRDQRELPRMRMALVGIRTKLKNRIQATLAKYAITIDEVGDVFGVEGRKRLRSRLEELPPETHKSVEVELELLDGVEDQIRWSETEIEAVVAKTAAMKLLMTAPGIGSILAVVIALEVGEVGRFGSPERLASYAGTVPRIKSSGGKSFLGKNRPDVNRYLKWAFVEAGNIVAINHKRWAGRHVGQLYLRVRERGGHGKAVVAVARHLAEASYWMLRRNEPYKEPKRSQAVSSNRESTR
jgi:transposase